MIPKLRGGDYVPDGAGGVERISGGEALLSEVLFRLTARRGSFPFREELGSRLWQLGSLPAARRSAAAAQYAAEALSDLTSLTVESAELVEDTGELTVRLLHDGEDLSVTLTVI